MSVILSLLEYYGFKKKIFSLYKNIFSGENILKVRKGLLWLKRY